MEPIVKAIKPQFVCRDSIDFFLCAISSDCTVQTENLVNDIQDDFNSMLTYWTVNGVFEKYTRHTQIWTQARTCLYIE